MNTSASEELKFIWKGWKRILPVGLRGGGASCIKINMPKILFLGDIVGRPGRSFVVERLGSLRQELSADIVIANAENSAGGAGITKKIADELLAAGVDAITLGDHVWDQKNFENEIGRVRAGLSPCEFAGAKSRPHACDRRKGWLSARYIHRVGAQLSDTEVGLSLPHGR